ncbi:MAG: methylmalonyl-CoA mutase [Chloroflexi bacterium]|nr:methylmalonyl-CoA mutase [Chloroflexota bacterium]
MDTHTERVAREEQRWARDKKVDGLPPARTETGKDVKPVYTPADIPHVDYLRDLGFPGEYPFTRGVYPGMYRVTPWQMRLYSGFGTAEDTNKRWKFLLASGNNGVAVALDVPTQLGLDSDHPMAEEEVGKLGAAIDTLRDMETMYDGLPLDKIVSSFNVNAVCPAILAMYVALAQKQGTPLSAISGTLANDLFCEYVSRGCYIFPPGPSLRLQTDVLEYCTRRLPRFYPYNIRGIIMREAGASMVQEMAFSFANAVAYVQAGIDRGLSVDDFGPRISFFFATGSEIFEEVAKYRASRRIWARTMKERFGAKKPQAMLLRFTATARGSIYEPVEPDNNVVRGAYAVLASALGGAQGMLHPALDEPFAIPTERTALLALRTQQVCAYETGIAKTADPLGGSYYVEHLTNEMEADILKLMQKIEEMGGAAKAIESGYMQKLIADEAFQWEQQRLAGEKVVVGVNKFQQERSTKTRMEFHKFDPTVRERQLQRLHQVKGERDPEAVQRTLAALQDAARKPDVNLIPPLIDAVTAYATVGETSEALKAVFGTFREPVVV